MICSVFWLLIYARFSKVVVFLSIEELVMQR